MSAQYLTAWRPSAIVAAHNALVILLATGANDPSITIHNSADTLLAEIPLASTPGTVNQATGLLTLASNGREESAPAGGTASYATIRDAGGNAMRSIPCQQGTAAVSGYCVLSTLTIVQGEPVELISATIV